MVPTVEDVLQILGVPYSERRASTSLIDKDERTLAHSNQTNDDDGEDRGDFTNDEEDVDPTRSRRADRIEIDEHH